MPLRIHILGSGSKGNCAIIESDETALMVDCGLTRKAMKGRAAELGVDEDKIEAVLVTHEHGDHVSGLGVCLRGMKAEGEMPIVCTAGTRANARYLAEYGNIVTTRSGDGFSIGDIHVDVFETSHDVAEPVGFRFSLDSGPSIGYLTDSGVVTPAAREMLAGCGILAIESNHDLRMLKNGPYPRYVKERVASSLGHLSNEQSGELLEGLLHDGLRQVVGMHMSQENNYVDLPRDVYGAVLARNGLDVPVAIAGQNIPKSFVCL